MSLPFWWIPNILTAAALAVCAIQGWRRRSLGLVLLGVYVAYELGMSIFVAVRQHARDAEYVRNFVPEQTDPNTWTVPVLHVNYDVAAPFVQALLLLAVVLLSRRLASQPAA